MYRDDREALLHRISVLEAQVVELEELRRRVATLEAELAVLRPPPPPPPPPRVPAGSGILQLRVEGPGENRIVTFDQDIVKIGRMANAHLRLDDPSVSRLHCVVERAGTTFVVIDLGSAEGMLVNDERVNKATIGPGDVIRVGRFRVFVL